MSEELPDTIASPYAHFLDSGSFTLWSQAEKYAREHNCGEWVFYETDEFLEYVDKYASFVRDYSYAIDICANLDVLPFRGIRTPPKGKDSHSLSYANLKRLEEYGLKPVPVVHYRANIDIWLRRYIEEGYPLIGLGGLVGSITDDNCRAWIDRCFDFICQGNGHPIVKIHGFGVTSHEYLLRYPWYSVDSTTWVKHAAYGHILVPRFRRGRYICSAKDLQKVGLPTENWQAHCQPWLCTLSSESKKRTVAGSLHYMVLKQSEKSIIRAWLEKIGIPLGNHKTGEPGVMTHFNYRSAANIFFFEQVRRSLPDFADWRWETARAAGFGLGVLAPPKQPAELKDVYIPPSKKLVIFYSGTGAFKMGPEYCLKEKATIMRTFHPMSKTGLPNNTFKKLLAARKLAIQGKKKK